ncbi:hypothetical protein FJY71_07125, partial [candidate division WOR-3 bacterium]|nr:hypothetical protein [candidate division WOR-3 bacterium]
APAPAITWTVRNQGANSAVGSWYDAVYLSADEAWDISDPLIERVQHTGDVAPAGSYTGSTVAALPAVVPGGYHVIVRTDIRNSVRETDDANNAGASSGLVAMDMQALTLGVTTHATIANNQDLYYRVDVTAGQDLLLTLNVAEPAQTEFYIRYAEPPSRGQFDIVYDNLYDFQQQITVAGTRQGSYYILLHGRQGAGSGEALDITAEVLSFDLRTVSPNHGSNLGQTTVTLTGSRFSANATATLVGPDLTERPATRVWWKDSNTLFATFDLTGLRAGAYDVRVDDDGQTDTEVDAFTVTAQPVGNVQVQMTVPGTLRPAQQGLVTVDYFNAGETDVLAPLLILSAENARLRLPGQADFAGSSVQFLGINDNGLAGVLPPGAAGRISIHFLPTINNGQVDFSLGMLADTDAIFDWSAMKNDVRPDHIPADAWDAIWSNFTDSVGTTLGSYQAVLCDNANYLSQLGEHVPDVSQLLAFELQQAGDSLPRATLAGAVDVSDAAPGLPLTFSRAFLQPISGRYTLGPLGRGWTHQWEVSLTTDPDQNVTIEVAGGLRFFRKLSSGGYAATPGDYGTLLLDQGKYRLQETDGTTLAFRSDGRLDYIQDTNGNRITCVYNGDKLTSLVHSNGDTLALGYNSLGRLVQITDPDGRVTAYAYDASGEHLTGVTGVDGTTTYTYSAAASGPTANALASIAYPGGTHDYFEYDAQGRLSRQYR